MIRRLFSVIFIVALVVLTAAHSAQCQTIPVNRVKMGIEPRVNFIRHQLILGKSWAGIARSNQPEINILAVSGPLRMRYAYSPRWSHNDLLIPTEPFVVSGSTFPKTDAAKPSPIALSWKSENSHVLEVSSSSGELRPTLRVRTINMSLDATGLVDDKPVTASQTWKTTLWSAGGTYVYSTRDMSVEVAVVAGDKSSCASATIVWTAGSGLISGMGYRWEETRFNDLKERDSTFFIGMTKEW